MKFFRNTAIIAALLSFAACKPENTAPGQGPDIDPGSGTQDETIEIMFTGMKVSPVKPGCQFLGESASRNHKYMAGMNYARFLCAVWNTETDEVVDIPGTTYGSLHSVSDEGVAVGVFEVEEEERYNPIVVENGKYEILPVPSGKYSEAYCISRDGSVIGGFFNDGTGIVYPCAWVDRKFVRLPVPEDTENVQYYGQCEVRWMNEDASILAGFTRCGMKGCNQWLFTTWKRTGDESWEVYRTLEDFGFGLDGQHEITGQPVELTAVSANGKYATAFLCGQHDMALYRFNLEDCTAEKGPVAPEVDGMVTHYFLATGVGDDGTILYCSDDVDHVRVGYLWRLGESEPVELAEYPGADVLVDFIAVTPCWMSSNCSSVAGFGTNSNNKGISFILY